LNNLTLTQQKAQDCEITIKWACYKQCIYRTIIDMKTN